MANQVKKLNADCANKIRRSQVITCVSDIVRELVDNSIDSGARSLKVMLDTFGLKKIEVKDSGHGISAEDIASIFQGGYTSKLHNESHLSCGNQYGFRGEALAAICSFNGMTVVTKTSDDQTANKYVLDKRGEIVSANAVPLPNGTVMTVRDVFSDFPVRHKYLSEIQVGRNELKDIESYLKSVSIANPSIYMILYHGGSMIWSKPSVKTTEQAIATVFGIAVAQNLTKCLLVELVPEQNENNETSWTGRLELFVPKAPVQMASVGFANNKMTMIFVNRCRVVVGEYENLIKRYVIGATVNPTEADLRNFPAAVLLIDVPPTEVDFNRVMNKSKIFLSCHDLVLLRLEEMLQSYYGISSNDLSTVQWPSSSVGADSEPVKAKARFINSAFCKSASSRSERSLMNAPAVPINSILKPTLSSSRQHHKTVKFVQKLTSTQKYDNSRKGISPSNPVLTLSGFSKPPRRDDEFPPWGTVLSPNNNANISPMGSSSTPLFRTPMTYTASAKKPKVFELFDVPVENYSSKTEVARRKQRQATLKSLKGCEFTSTSVGSPAFCVPRLTELNSTPDLNVSFENTEINEALIPKTLAFMSTKGLSWNEPRNSDYVNTSSENEKLPLSCLRAPVNLASLKSKKSAQPVQFPQQTSNGLEIQVIAQLENPSYYIVKLDGVLGAFNPVNVLALRPHLMKHELGSDYTHKGKNSDECIGFLLQEFTKLEIVLDSESVSQVYNTLFDLKD